ncbi:hypothetical protein PF006_g14490, partial [Phytophthora fragariae]
MKETVENVPDRTSSGGLRLRGQRARTSEGICVFHGQQDGDTTATSATASTTAGSLPEDVVNVAVTLFTGIVDFCVEMAKRSMQVFDAEFVDAQG